MNTPITDAASVDSDAFDSPDNAREFARRLETDRAALMEALERIQCIPNKPDGGDWDEIEDARMIAESAYFAARANFPTP